ncbi:hypothetical protein GGH92_001551 [Coemansia sp. RSA 2673]|nr:hypothetical protein GGH92_001551 [Coemansia sp. RSA 2673]KAJ2431507.1 hypothetical protein GGF41_000517 [Coemansia sp. RSA 2531]
MGTAQADPSRIPTCPTSSRAGAISGNNTNANASNAKRPDEWQVQTRSRSKKLANQNNGFTKENIGAVG